MSRPRSTITSVPPSARQRYRLQNPVRSPQNHSDPSGAQVGWQIDSRRSPPATTVRVPDSSTTSRVASHGMSGWSHSSQHHAPPSGRQRGSDTKSGPCYDDLGHGRSVGVQPHDRVDDVTPGPVGAGRAVVLLHAQQRRAVGGQVPVGVAQAPRHGRLRRQRHRFAVGSDPMQPLGRPVGEPQHTADDPPRPAAVLVDGRAGVPRGRHDLGDGPVGGPAATRRCARLPRVGPPTTTGRRRPRRRR